MSLAKINYLCVIYALLHSDWLALNPELELRNPGRSAQTYFSFPPPAHFRTCMRNAEKYGLLVRLECVRVCVYVCVCVCVCVAACVFVCASFGVGLRACV